MRVFKKAILLSVILLVVSCNFTENLEMQPDGTGTFVLEMDGSGFMDMAGDKLANGLSPKKDTKTIDSTFSFKQLLESKKDSIALLSADQQAALKKLENFVMRFKIDPEQKRFLFNINTPFKNVNELQDMLGSMTALKGLKKDSTATAFPIPINQGLGENNSQLSMSYNGKTFVRKAIMLTEKPKIAADSLGMGKMIFASSSYTLKYHFPKAVKTVSNPDALFSADRKTITIQYPFLDYMEHPEKLNLNVSFE